MKSKEKQRKNRDNRNIRDLNQEQGEKNRTAKKVPYYLTVLKIIPGKRRK